MTTSGGFPAPGPQDDQRYAVPPAGGWGPPAAWGPAQQAQLLTAHKPGIIALHPLALGAILDGAVKAVRYNPKSMIGLSALVMALFLVPSAVVSLWTVNLLSGLTTTPDDAATLLQGVGTLSQVLFTQIATIILSGLLVYVVGEAVLGRRPTVGQTWRATRGRLLPLIGLNLLVGLAIAVLAAVLLGPGVLLLVNGSTGPGVLLVVLGAVGFVGLAVILSVKTSLAGPTVVLEKHGVITALRRSWSLTRGAFWRLLGITLLADLIAGFAGWLLALPFSIAAIIALGVVGDIGDAAMASTFLDHLATLLSGSITTPFVAAVTGLLYIDRRMRVEALDVVLVREAQSGNASRG